MTQFLRPIVLILAVAGCAGSVPDSNPAVAPAQVDIGRGVGFGDYQSYEAARLQRDADLSGSGASTGPVATPPEAGNMLSGNAISASELRAAGLPSGQGSGLPDSGTVASQPLPAAGASTAQAAPMAPARTNNPGISDEQSFEAVSSRETIESDAERLARNRAQYEVVQPQAVPQRTGAEGPNIVQYALQTTNRKGQPIYRRGGLFAERRYAQACAKYPSPDLAQQAFLAAGGPERDRLGVDPDGDGFACAWDPAPFRAARG